MGWALPLGVAVVTLVAVVAAFNPAPHTGGDNAGYVSLAYSLLKHHTYTEVFDPAGLPHTKYPPVFPAVLAGLMLLGVRTWVGLKSVAVVSTVAIALLTQLWARRRMGSLAATAVALLVALSSAVIYYSHWILSDPLFVAFTLLSLWALERTAEPESGSSGGPAWLALGVTAAVLAYLTRSAGLPLLVAILAWLALRRRWRALAASVVGIGVPALLWWLRSRSVAHTGYGSEFWLVDPYTPDLGRVGIGGLLGRLGTNLVGYVGTHVPGGIVGTRGGAVTLLGVVLVALAAVGWARAARGRFGATEIFVPLYAGLILLWPVVWSGDRFALPLFPFLFGYAALSLRWGAQRWGRGPGTLVAAVAFLVAFLPAVKSWTGVLQEASACGAMVRARGAFGCYGPRVESFVEAAGWSGANLPDGAAVLTRKPRIFYVMGGVPSRTFPFTDDPAALLALADSLGARYVLLDQWDGQATRFVAGSVRRDPGAFCALHGFQGDGGGAQMLGILPPGERPGVSSGEEPRIVRCPASFVRGDGNASYASSSGSIPLLLELDP